MTQTEPEAPGKTDYFLYNPDEKRRPNDWHILKGDPPTIRMVRLSLDADESAAFDVDIAQRGEEAVARDTLKRIGQDNEAAA